jgi:hypothetical protein
MSKQAAADAGSRHISLPRGQLLEVRPMVASDVDELESLYGRLPADDLNRRFFTASPPPRQFVAEWASLLGRGGFGLVAITDGGPIVAEAGYVPLPDGDGELAMTVAPGWRGWLGPFLLDLLVQGAAARGVPNLQADVLTTNGQMMSLISSRGYAVMDMEDWSSIRVVIGAASRTPCWPGAHDRPRLLFEAPAGRWVGNETFVKSGFQVMGCPGPMPGPRPRCPLITGEPCPLAAGADLIVTSLPAELPSTLAVVTGHDRRHQGVPVYAAAASPSPEETVAMVRSTGFVPRSGVRREPNPEDRGLPQLAVLRARRREHDGSVLVSGQPEESDR